MMHLFSLVIGSIIGHEWAVKLLERAQRLVTYFRASYNNYHYLLEAREQFNISTRLRTSNTTRFTSVHLCLVSVQKLRMAFTLVLSTRRALITNRDVVATIEDHSFWAELDSMCRLLQPFSQAVMAIQSDQATLADCLRYWLYLAKALTRNVVGLPSSFKQHAFYVFNKRWAEGDLPIIRLALFLDPRYRAVSTSRNQLQSLIDAAARHWQKCSHSQDEEAALCNQIRAYYARARPFDIPHGGPGFDVRNWWASITDDAATQLRALATKLFSIVPHGASVERLFSLLAWYHTDTRNSLKSSTVEAMAAIKLHHQQRQPR
jgi:hAT family C-terminal dimerisation region